MTELNWLLLFIPVVIILEFLYFLARRTAFFSARFSALARRKLRMRSARAIGSLRACTTARRTSCPGLCWRGVRSGMTESLPNILVLIMAAPRSIREADRVDFCESVRGFYTSEFSTVSCGVSAGRLHRFRDIAPPDPKVTLAAPLA